MQKLICLVVLIAMATVASAFIMSPFGYGMGMGYGMGLNYGVGYGMGYGMPGLGLGYGLYSPYMYGGVGRMF